MQPDKKQSVELLSREKNHSRVVRRDSHALRDHPNRATQRVSPNRLAGILSGIVVGLLLANAWSYFVLAENSLWAIRLDVNKERNFATCFSVLLLLSCGVLLWQVSRCLSLRSRFIRHWQVLSVLFVGMAADEWFSMHERVNQMLDDRFYTTGFLYYDWVIPGSLFVMVVALAYIRFLRSLPHKTRNRFLRAGGLYVGGALGMEMVSGYHIYYNGLGERGVLAILNGIEESLEMFGLIAFIYALLIYLQSLPARSR